MQPVNGNNFWSSIFCCGNNEVDEKTSLTQDRGRPPTNDIGETAKRSKTPDLKQAGSTPVKQGRDVISTSEDESSS